MCAFAVLISNLDDSSNSYLYCPNGRQRLHCFIWIVFYLRSVAISSVLRFFFFLSLHPFSLYSDSLQFTFCPSLKYMQQQTHTHSNTHSPYIDFNALLCESHNFHYCCCCCCFPFNSKRVCTKCNLCYFVYVLLVKEVVWCYFFLHFCIHCLFSHVLLVRSK